MASGREDSADLRTAWSQLRDRESRIREQLYEVNRALHALQKRCRHRDTETVVREMLPDDFTIPFALKTTEVTCTECGFRLSRLEEYRWVPGEEG